MLSEAARQAFLSSSSFVPWNTFSSSLEESLVKFADGIKSVSDVL